MIIGIDVDDTLTDRTDYVRPFIEKYFKEHNKPFKFINPHTASAIQMFDWEYDDFVEFTKIAGWDYLMDVPPKKDAVKIMRKLKKDGHTIIVITARTLVDPYNVTQQWLDKHGIEVDKIIAHASKKSKACIESKVDIFLDDNVEVIEELLDNGVNAYMMRAHYNGNVKTRAPIINDFNHFYEVIKQYEKRKENKNGKY